MSSRRQKFRLHCCALDRVCRRHTDGLLWRIEINTPWWHLGIALTPSAQYARVDGCDWFTFRKWKRT